MATAGDLADEVARRVRDPDNTATTRDLLLRILTQAQRLVNAQTRALLAEAEFTIDSDNSILDIATMLPLAVRVETLREGTRDITKCASWKEIAEVDRFWLKRTGGRIEMWCHFSPSKVIVYPRPVETTTVRAVCTRYTNALTLDTDEIELADNLHPAILNLAEQLLLMRMRLFPSLEAIQGRAALEMDLVSR